MSRHTLAALWSIGFLSGVLLPVSCHQPATPEPSGSQTRKLLTPEDLRDHTATKSTTSTETSATSDSQMVIPGPPALATEIVAPATEVKLEALDLQGFKDFVAQNKGKRMVVDCWATWCGVCVENFPKFVQLAEKKQTADFIFVSMALDSEEEPVLEFLKKQKAFKLRNLLMTTDAFEVNQALEFDALPHYFLFDAEGKPQKFEHFSELAQALTK